MNKTLVFVALATGGLMAQPLWAAEAPAFSNDPIVVTASRSQQADAGLSSTATLTREDIERSQAPDLLELLRLQAGIDLARAGGPGAQTSLFMRGSNSNHVLVLIDGMRVSAVGTGGLAWETLDVGIIERIEIVRGPQAARWGSDAIGGVIQIFTRKPEGAEVHGAWGRYRDRRVSASMGNQHFGLSASVRKVQGFSAQNENGFSWDPDKDGMDNFSLSLGGQAELGPGQFSWQARGNDGQVEFDQGVSDIQSWSAMTRWQQDLGSDWNWQLSAGLHRDELDTRAPFGDSITMTRRAQMGVQTEYRLGDHSIWLLGLDGWRESGYSSGAWQGDRHNLGGWTGLEGSNERFDWQASLRADRDQRFGSATTGSLGAGYHPSENWRVSARVSRAFRAPDFNQLYYQGFGGLFAGNPDLDPETARAAEIGLDWTPAQGHRIGLSAHETRISDLIDFSGPDFGAINIARARIRGVELVHRFTGQHWRSELNLTWQEPEDRASGERLMRRAEKKLGGSLDYLLANGSWVGLELSYTGPRPDVGDIELPGLTLVNLRAGLPLGDGFRLEGRVDNATDREYQPLWGYNAARRSAHIALRWQY